MRYVAAFHNVYIAIKNDKKKYMVQSYPKMYRRSANMPFGLNYQSAKVKQTIIINQVSTDQVPLANHRAHNCWLQYRSVWSELCKNMYVHRCMHNSICTVTHINLQSHVHTQAHTEQLCNRLSPFHPLKKKSQESLECEMLETSCIQIISRAQQIPSTVCLLCLFGSRIPAD